ncbi:MAG: ribonuclease HII [bacterium]|nr:ribonuclease HII [bacterium]
MNNFLVGIDEVGRGPLAGPVTVSALAIPHRLRGSFKDSKKLSATQRKKLLIWIKSRDDIVFSTASVYPTTIDRINITQAANLAATRAMKKLLMNQRWHKKSKIKVLLDGGLYLNSSLLKAKAHNLKATTYVRGDGKYNAIKLASIVAKTKRDAMMARYHKKYPQYNFNEHKGYGTKRHLSSLKKYGVSKIHRLTFLKNYPKLIANKL